MKIIHRKTYLVRVRILQGMLRVRDGDRRELKTLLKRNNKKTI